MYRQSPPGRGGVRPALGATTSTQTVITVPVPSYQAYRPQVASAALRGRHRSARRRETLKNAIGTGRLAQAFIFAGPRGVGKTTTARILARALNCVNGPTPEPCGMCDACVEIAEGRDVDVLEIDGATYTGVDAGPRGHRRAARHRADARPLQDLHHRRGPPPVEERVRRAAEVDRRAAAVRQVHDGDDGAARGAGDDSVAVAGVRAQDAAVQRDSRSAQADDRRTRRSRSTTPRWRSSRGSAEGSMRDALERARPGARVHGRPRHARGRQRPCSASSAAICSSTSPKPWRAKTPRRAFALAGQASSKPGFDLRIVCRELARLMRDLLVIRDRSGTRLTIPRSPPRRARSSQGAGGTSRAKI